MYVVHVVRQFWPGMGGLEDFVLQLARRQIASGHQVRVVTLDRIFDDTEDRRLRHEDAIDGIDIVRLRWRGSKRYPIAPGVLRAINGADIVHVHALDFFYDFLALTRPLHRRRLVFSTHGLFFHTPFASRLKSIYFATVTRLASVAYGAVVASSVQDRERFFRIRRKGLETIENGVALDKFAGLARRDSRTIIAFGRIAPNKRLDRLIDWFAHLKAVDPTWSLVIAGKPMGIALEDLAAQARAAGIGDAVTFHRTPSDAELRELISNASVFASASEYEGFGLAAIEAAASGLYLALSPIEPYKRSLDATGYGLIVDFADPSSTHAFLETHRQNGAEPAAPSSLKARFGWEAVSAEFDRLYQAVTGERSRRIKSVEICSLTAKEAVDAIAKALDARAPRWVAFANQHTVNVADRDPEVWAMLDTSLVLPDGVAIDVASKLLYGSAFPENLNGSDFLPLMIKQLPPQRLFLLGSADGVAAKAASMILTIAPQHAIVGTHHGFLSPSSSPELKQRIRHSGATLLLVGMGHPHQERWIARYAGDLDVVSITVGAWFDFLAGTVPRAPLWMRQRRLEWLYRLKVEPGRMFSRYITGGVSFGARIIRQWVQGYRI